MIRKTVLSLVAIVFASCGSEITQNNENAMEPASEYSDSLSNEADINNTDGDLVNREDLSSLDADILRQDEKDLYHRMDSLDSKKDLSPLDADLNPDYTDSKNTEIYTEESGVINLPPVGKACNDKVRVNGKCPDLAVPKGKYACLCFGKEIYPGSCGEDYGQAYPNVFPAGSYDPEGNLGKICRKRLDTPGENCSGSGCFSDSTYSGQPVTLEVVAIDMEGNISEPDFITLYEAN